MGIESTISSPPNSGDATMATAVTTTTPNVPTVILMIGMAGSGKSTLMHRILLDMQARKKRVYSINLDPAVRNVQYPINIDIRDTVKYKEVMKHFKLGPNGAIMTALNLFATRFDQVLSMIDKRAPELDYVLIDTPGQIEAFGEALDKDETTYLQALARSMSLALEEFYINLNNCGVSATTGEGLGEFQESLDKAVEEYKTQYLDYLRDQKETMNERRERIIQDRLEKFEQSLDKSQPQNNTRTAADTLLGSIMECDDDE